MVDNDHFFSMSVDQSLSITISQVLVQSPFHKLLLQNFQKHISLAKHGFRKAFPKVTELSRCPSHHWVLTRV
jgi:hypothetical protein